MRRTRQPATTPTFQTVRLKRGRHISPEHGVCVMELASMLADERFSDHPRCVSPAVAEFLRTYNDLIDDQRRQDLYRFAAASIGSRSSRTTERLRIDCLPVTPGADSRLARLRTLTARGRAARARDAAIALAVDPAKHDTALALVEALIAIGAEDSGSSPRRGRVHSHSDPAKRVPHSQPAVRA
jgi:hypothetical protein